MAVKLDPFMDYTPAEAMEAGRNKAKNQISEQWLKDPQLYYQTMLPSDPLLRDYFQGRFNDIYSNWYTQRQKGIDQNLMSDPFGGGTPKAATLGPGGYQLMPYEPPTWQSYLQGFNWQDEYNKLTDRQKGFYPQQSTQQSIWR